MKLSIILATRGRSDLLLQTLRRTCVNMIRDDTTLLVISDDDDPLGFDPASIHPQVRGLSRPRPLSIGEKYNQVMAVAPADLYLVMVDYAPHVTPGFDQRIINAASIYPDGYAAVYNRHANLSLPGINAVTHKLATAMGGIYPRYYPYWFVDHHLDDIAQMIGRVVFADVVIDTTERKESADKCWTQGQRETWLWALLFDALAPERARIARSIIAAEDFEDFWERKCALLNNIPMVAHHSTMANSNARQMQGSDKSTDEWYAKVRTRGLAKLCSVVAPEIMAQVEELASKLQQRKECG